MVDSKMFQWKQEGPVCAHVSEEVGRSATTWFRAVSHARHIWPELNVLSFSLVTIRIGTGRRHQIRTHITHIGHPTVMDAKYADVSVMDVEAEIVARTGGTGQLHSRRFPSVYPQHVGVDPETLNPAYLLLIGSNKKPAPATAPSTSQIAGSRGGPCSRTARRVDAQGRDMDRCIICGGFGHWSRECPAGGQGRCLVCGQMGHRAKDCPEGGDTCLFCGKIGHLQRECPQLNAGLDPWKPLCFDFKTEGSCKFGRACPFAHRLTGA
eukprot:gnl/TRDRNA2_/TRDRNA2_146618_c2_seq1.p1 gnl/TRDRNA2_/TRDRNA2_146618_c2~~gnl/TRDRNA2_/TRDRNA2_146618_c2_seq1.p1  ORF type:complete len:266 (-),score=17.02 gnl/TRDRNA2_/TRDRNA2_146618_c2_seq1:9-806(-)